MLNWMRAPLLPLLIAVSVPCMAQTGSARVFEELEKTTTEIEKVSGMQAQKKVRYEMIRRNQVRDFLKQRVKETVKPEQIRAEEITLKKFGFVPKNFDLEKSTVDLLTEQAAAFYDYRKQRLFLLEGTSNALMEMAIVHEMAHAIADQNFNLQQFIDGAGENDDSALARLTVMEGQATWLTAEVLAQRNGRSLAGDSVLFDQMAEASSGMSQYPVFQSVPLYLRETLIFPYTRGMRFQQTVYEKMGKEAFAEVFKNPPLSTQQVLHPATYFDKVKPASPELPEPAALKKKYKVLAEGKMGELDHAVLIREHVSREDAERIAPRWRGGKYRVWEKDKKRAVLCYSVEWDSPDTAREYFGLYARILEHKWEKINVTSRTDSELKGMGEDGYFLVRQTGSVVTSVEGLEAPE
jgi:hypothetical protein